MVYRALTSYKVHLGT